MLYFIPLFHSISVYYKHKITFFVTDGFALKPAQFLLATSEESIQH